MMQLEDEADLTVPDSGQFVVFELREVFAIQQNTTVGRAIQSSDDVQKRAFS